MQDISIPECLFKRPLAVAALVALATSVVNAADYQSTVLGDNPSAFYRLNDPVNRTPINLNSGTLGAAGNATNDLPPGVVHPFPGALAGDGNRSEFFDFTTRTEIPWNPALNTPNTQPFTVEAWFYPASDQTATGQSPLANRYAWSGENRQGWVFFQRKPNADYLGGEQVGWNFRMYNGIGTSGRLDVTSLVPYEVGKWQHVVVVYDPVEVTNATVTIYIDGVAANTNIWNGGSGNVSPEEAQTPIAPPFLDRMRGLGKALGVDIMEETSQRGSGGSVQQVVARPYFYGTRAQHNSREVSHY